MSRTRFKLREVEALTGLSERQLQYYVLKGFIARYPQGGQQVYSWRSCFEALTIAALKAHGVSVQAMGYFFRNLRKWLERFPLEELQVDALFIQYRPGLPPKVAWFLVGSPEQVQGKDFIQVNFRAASEAVNARDATGHEITGTVQQGAAA